MKTCTKTILFSMIIWNFNSWGSANVTFQGRELDDRREIDGVVLHNTRYDDTRVIHASLIRQMHGNIDLVVQKVLRFQDRCNNEYKDRRELSDKNFHCSIHNANLVESFPVRNLKKDAPKPEGSSDFFLLWRKVYNREEFNYYDLVVRRDSINKEGKRVVEIKYNMLKDEDVGKYLENYKKRNSVFTQIEGKYLITELDKAQTNVDMTYVSATDHWMLNTGLAVGVLYKNVAKGTKDTLDQLEASLGPALSTGKENTPLKL